jgi:bacteriorhodopsin
MFGLLQAGDTVDVGALTGPSDFWLWFTWGGMTIATIIFLVMATRSGGVSLHHYIIGAIITLWAAMSYIIMATGSGITTVALGDGGTRLFYYMRYIDWLVTTPLLLIALSLVAMGGRLRNPRLVAYIVLADIGMILTGLWASSIGGGSRWILFIISSVFFAIVLYFIWFAPRSLSVEARETGGEGRPGLFQTLAIMLTVLWFLYPIVWIFGTEGTSVFSNGFEVFSYAVLDILAKIAWAFVLLGGIGGTLTSRRA